MVPKRLSGCQASDITWPWFCPPALFRQEDRPPQARRARAKEARPVGGSTTLANLPCSRSRIKIALSFSRTPFASSSKQLLDGSCRLEISPATVLPFCSFFHLIVRENLAIWQSTPIT